MDAFNQYSLLINLYIPNQVDYEKKEGENVNIILTTSWYIAS